MERRGKFPPLSRSAVSEPGIRQPISDVFTTLASVWYFSETAVSPERDFLVDIEETSYNVFYVPTASGSPYVPVQADFVAKYGVQSVLCFGGLLSSKDLFAVILFSKIQIERETANLCKSLALGVKLSLLPFVDGRAAVSSAEAPDAGQPARQQPAVP